MGRCLKVDTVWAAITSSVLLLLASGYSSSGHAAEYVSIAGERVNLRAGPGLNHTRRWVVSRGYPLKVLKRKDGWAQVRDFEGDTAWVAQRLLSERRMAIVTADLVNIRQQPGTDHPIAFQAERLVLLRYLGRKGDWVHVRHPDGDEGWVHERLVWGD